MTDNIVCWNGREADEVYGIDADKGSTVSRNTASENGTSATGSYIGGIYAKYGCTVTGNTVRKNGAGATSTVLGIWLQGSCLVDQNTAYENGGTNMNTPLSCSFGVNEY